jgi:photosystem II stability/assembly factor-like uncharacterized protein
VDPPSRSTLGRTSLYHSREDSTRDGPDTWAARTGRPTSFLAKTVRGLTTLAPVLIVVASILACSSTTPYPTTTGSGGLASNSPYPTTIASPSPSICTPAKTGWVQANSLTHFVIHDGHANTDACHLILVGEQVSPSEAGAILGSDDGGRTVRVLSLFPQALHLNSIALSDANTAWVAGGARDGSALLLKSVDGGSTWGEVSVPALGASVELRVVVSSESQIWVAGTADCTGVLLSTSDGGDHWQQALQLPAAGACAYLTALTAVDGTILAAGDDGVDGVALMSHNAGQTFQRSPRPPASLTSVLGVAVLGTSEAFVAGYYRTNPNVEEARDPRLLHTSDDGLHWDQVAVPASLYIGDLKFSSSQRGYAIAGSEGPAAVLITNDGGLTWEVSTPSPSLVTGLLERVFLAGDGVVYAVGEGGLFALGP